MDQPITNTTTGIVCIIFGFVLENTANELNLWWFDNLVGVLGGIALGIVIGVSWNKISNPKTDLGPH
jgi:hypothetical protein